MSRYINIDDISLRKTISVGGLSAKALWRRIQQEPSIDIVRCKECKHAHMTYGGDCKYCDMWKDDDDFCIELYLDGDFYCSYGERKDKCKECWYWSEVHKRCENKGGCQFKPYGERKESE